MTYVALKQFPVMTPSGKREVTPGERLNLMPELARKWSEQGLIVPELEEIAQKAPWAPPPSGYLIIYSHVLKDVLLLTDTAQRADALRASGIEEPIYIADEIPELKRKNPEELIALHKFRKAFPGSRLLPTLPVKQGAK